RRFRDVDAHHGSARVDTLHGIAALSHAAAFASAPAITRADGPCSSTGWRRAEMPGAHRRIGEASHLVDEIGLAFEADAGKLRHRDRSTLDRYAVGEATERLEQVGIRFVAAQSQAGRDVERHLVPAVWDAALRRPAMLVQHIEGAQVFHEAI